MHERPVFLSPDALRLRSSARLLTPEEIRTNYVQKEIDWMLTIVADRQAPKPESLHRPLGGLAHTQIATNGDPLAIIIVDRGAKGNNMSKLGENLAIIINPIVTPLGDPNDAAIMENGREACFSVDERVTGYVNRAKRVRVEGFDRNGKKIEPFEAEGFQARLFQHEADHLRGILYIDHIKDPSHLMLRDVDNALYEYLRTHTTDPFKTASNPYPHRATQSQLYNTILGNRYDH
jgi:peptide deformylase